MESSVEDSEYTLQLNVSGTDDYRADYPSAKTISPDRVELTFDLIGGTFRAYVSGGVRLKGGGVSEGARAKYPVYSGSAEATPVPGWLTELADKHRPTWTVDPANPADLISEESAELVESLGQQLYRAEDSLAFLREQLDSATGPLDREQVRRWLDGAGCMHADPEQGPSVESLVRMLRQARLSAIQGAFRVLDWTLQIEAGNGPSDEPSVSAAEED